VERRAVRTMHSCRSPSATKSGDISRSATCPHDRRQFNQGLLASPRTATSNGPSESTGIQIEGRLHSSRNQESLDAFSRARFASARS